MSTVRANQFLDAAGGNTATINGMTPTAQSLQGFRNRIINGGMVIDQRNAGAAVTSGYAVDRFEFQENSGSAYTIQRSTTAPAGFTNSVLITVTTAASATSAQVNRIFQRIEGNNIADLGFGTASASTVTLSFWVRSSLTGTYCASLVNNAANRAYVAEYSISTANTWEYKTITIAGDTTGTWETGTSSGIQVTFDLGSGSDYNATAGSWVAANDFRTTNQVNFANTSGATFYITGVQLEAGSVATPFERRDYGRELMMCQRYYWQQARGNNLMISLGTLYDASNLNGYVQFPVSMRTTPSIVQTTGTNYYIFERAAATDFFDAFGLLTRGSTACAQLFIGSGISGASGGQSGIIFTNNASAAIGYNAEL